MPITEPTTMITDYVLAAACVYFAAALWSGARGSKAGVVTWTVAFMVTAVAALAGGTAHGFRVPLGTRWDAVWSVTVWSIAASSVLLISAGVRSALRPDVRDAAARSAGLRWLKRAIVVTLVGLAVLVAKVAIHEHFNQNDIYHLIQMGGLYCLYRGARLLGGIDW